MTRMKFIKFLFFGLVTSVTFGAWSGGNHWSPAFVGPVMGGLILQDQVYIPQLKRTFLRTSFIGNEYHLQNGKHSADFTVYQSENGKLFSYYYDRVGLVKDFSNEGQRFNSQTWRPVKIKNGYLSTTFLSGHMFESQIQVMVGLEQTEIQIKEKEYSWPVVMFLGWRTRSKTLVYKN